MDIRIIRHIGIICLSILLGGCVANRSKDRDAIAVSFEPQAWLVEQIAGDDFDIITLLPAVSDPETYQPSISTMSSLGNASVYFSLGTEGFEQSLTQNISKNFPQLKITDCADGVNKIYGSHGSIYHDQHSDSFDPHLLASIRNSITIAENIENTLAELYPDKAPDFKANGNKLRQMLTLLDDSIKKMNLDGKSLVIRHPSLEYFARDYGLVQIPLNDVRKETSPGKLMKRIDAAKQLKPTIMVVEKEHEYSSDFDISRQLGTDTIRVSLNSATWIDDLMRISHEIDRD